MLAGVAFGSPAALSLSIRNRWPSGDTSYWRGGNGVGVLGVEHLRRLARAEGRSGRLDRHRGERIRCIEVEQLATVPRPRGARPARRRDLPAAAVHLRERPHVDLAATRTQSTGTRGSDRRARTPARLRRTASRRTAPRPTGSHRPMGRPRSAAPAGAPDPKTAGRRRSASGHVVEADDECPVRRDGRRVLRVRRSSSAGRRYRCRRRPGCTGSRTPERSDVKMIRRPSGVQSGSPSMPGAKVKRLSVSPREIPDPDVGVLLIRGCRPPGAYRRAICAGHHSRAAGP